MTLWVGVGRVASLTMNTLDPSDWSRNSRKGGSLAASIPLRSAASSRTFTVLDSMMSPRRSRSTLTGTLAVSQGTSIYNSNSRSELGFFQPARFVQQSDGMDDIQTCCLQQLHSTGAAFGCYQIRFHLRHAVKQGTTRLHGEVVGA